MAKTKIISAVIPAWNDGIMVDAAAAVDATDGAEVDFSPADQKLVVLVTNANASAAKKVIFKKGGFLQSVEDFEKSIPAGQTWAFAMESGAFKQKDGTLAIEGESSDIKIQAVVLP